MRGGYSVCVVFVVYCRCSRVEILVGADYTWVKIKADIAVWRKSGYVQFGIMFSLKRFLKLWF